MPLNTLPPATLLDECIQLQATDYWAASAHLRQWMLEHGGGDLGLSPDGLLTVSRQKDWILESTMPLRGSGYQRTMDLRPGRFTGKFGPGVPIEAPSRPRDTFGEPRRRSRSAAGEAGPGL